jgi:hypothetical protein
LRDGSKEASDGDDNLSIVHKVPPNLAVTELQATTLATRQQAVRKAVEKDFVVLKSFLTGSYKRSTLIAPLNEADVDIFFVLDSDYHKADGHAALLDKLRATLLKTYTKTPKVSRNGHAVTITFTDFVVDAVPPFNRQGGGYLIPDSVGKRWISTDPTVHEKVVSASNAAHSGSVVPVVKMIKRWNREVNRSFRSFYLELIAVEIFSGVTLTDDPSAFAISLTRGEAESRRRSPTRRALATRSTASTVAPSPQP